MNNNTNNQNNNPNNSQQPPKDVKKQQEQQAAEEVGSLAARGAADYFTGGQYEKIRNAPVVGKAAQGLEKAAGKTVGKAANKLTGGKVGEASKKLKDSGVTNAADKAMGVIVGSAGGAKGGKPNASTPTNKPNVASQPNGNSASTLNNNGLSNTKSNSLSSAPKENNNNNSSISKNDVMNNNFLNNNKNSLKGSKARSANNFGNTPINSNSNNNNFNNIGNKAPNSFADPSSGAGELNNDNNDNNNVNDINEAKQQLKKKRENEKRTKMMKGIASFFMKNPMAMLVVFIGIGFFAISIYFLFVLAADEDLVGQGVKDYSDIDTLSNSNDPYSSLSLCNEIILIKEDDRKTGDTVTNIDDVDLEETVTLNNTTFNRWEYQTIKIEDYVKGVVQAEAIDVNDESTFEVATIAARTFALGITSKMCRTWDNENKNTAYRNPQNYTKDTVDSSISSAASKTVGIIMVYDNDLLNMDNGNYYDYFCYIDKTNDNNDVFRYNMLQENEEERLAIPNDWVEDNVPDGDHNRSGKYGNECQQEGMSLFGAKYNLTKELHEYTTLRTLKYYYGYDIEFRKMQSAVIATGGNCFWWPLEGGVGRMSSGFGPRNAPTAGASTYHKGQDIAVPEGTNVLAAASGTVIKAGAATGYGYAVYIDHGNGIITRYGHLKADGIKVHEGQSVNQGDVIALSGNTGVSSGPHLHFEVRPNDVPVDPLNYISQSAPTPNCSTQLNFGGVINTGNNPKSICLALKGLGYSNEAIAGVLTNFHHENTAFNPATVNGIGCVGIAQWCFGRKNNLMSYPNPYTIETQISFLLWEIQGGNNQAVNANRIMVSGGTPSNLAYEWCMKFEVPGEQYCIQRRDAVGIQNQYLQMAQNGCN